MSDQDDSYLGRFTASRTAYMVAVDNVIAAADAAMTEATTMGSSASKVDEFLESWRRASAELETANVNYVAAIFALKARFPRD